MKKWICLCLCLLLLSGCGKEAAVAADRPYALEVEYGDSGVDAMTGAYTWGWAGETAEEGASASSPDPLSILSDIPYVNQSKAGELKLLFPVEPDSLSVQYRTNADGYSEAVPLTVSGNALPAPGDGAGYLFEVTAVWDKTEQAACWGTCTYYFRCLPAGDTGESENISLYRLLQLEPSDLFGVDVFNNGENTQKSCRTTADKETILTFLRNNLATDFVQTQAPDLASDYVLRLTLTDGGQLTVGYAEDGGSARLLLGGVPYEARPMDLDSLWSSLKAKTQWLSQTDAGNYLQVSEAFPGGDWGQDSVCAYLRGLTEQAVYDEILWIDDPAEPNGYRLEPGETGLQLPLAADCQFWILENHYQPYCQVTAPDLWQYAQTTGWDLLFRLYLRDGQIIAVCEQYRP